MFQTLNGRIMWKQTTGGVFITIPARRGAMTHLYGPLVGFWLIAAAFRYRNLLDAPHMQDTEFTLQMVSVSIYVLGFIFAVCWLLWVFTKETGVLINPHEMKVRRMVMFVPVAGRTFETSDVRGLRFIPATTTWASMGHPDPRTSKVQFQAGDKTYTLATGVSEHEAGALFAAMSCVYRFPDYPSVNFARYGY
ncbi:MAG: hypothetical protein ABSF28_04990 [Terracidiphilus sp.]|jgi:hypothetical protein